MIFAIPERGKEVRRANRRVRKMVEAMVMLLLQVLLIVILSVLQCSRSRVSEAFDEM